MPMSARSMDHSAANSVMVLSKGYFVSDQIKRYTFIRNKEYAFRWINTEYYSL